LGPAGSLGRAGRLAGAGEPGAAPQQALEPRQEYGQLEGLGEVIVGAGRESLEHVFWAAARREDENGHVVLRLAQRGDHGEAVHARQHHV
jgi:hypothetical protein